MRQTIAAVIGLTVSMVFSGPAAGLDVGDPLPLKVSQWIKGGPVDLQAGKGRNIYVVELWATWCRPCLTSIPHLTTLQKKYKDQGVVIIGLSDETAEKVRPFVESQGARMDYVVAVDDGRSTTQELKKAFKIQGIPHAWIVDKTGAIVYHGHPMDQLESVLDQVVEGTWDAAQFKRAKRVYEELFPQYRGTVILPGQEQKAAELGRQIVKEAGSHTKLYAELAFLILKDQRIAKPDFELALAAATRAHELSRGREVQIEAVYGMALFHAGRTQEGLDQMVKAKELTEDERLKQIIEQERQLLVNKLKETSGHRAPTNEPRPEAVDRK